MIIAYIAQPTLSTLIIDEFNYSQLKNALWVDVFSPTAEENTWIEAGLGIMMPTRAAMQEIEISSRLYQVENRLYMTATLIAGSTSLQPKDDSVTFILTPKQLLTLRYIEPTPFILLAKEMKLDPQQKHTSLSLMVRLLERTIDRLADILEMVVSKLDHFSREIFNPALTLPYTPALNYTALLQEIGQSANLSGKSRESLLTLSRLISFLSQSAFINTEEGTVARLHTLNKDIHSLSDYATFITTKINFLLDGTLGMVNIEQNNIIKIFSVAAVIFLPPTLIASIYGMNFHMMPELDWKYGYIFAVGLMISSAIIPYRFFKKRKWL